MRFIGLAVIGIFSAWAQTPEHLFHPKQRLTGPSGLAPREIGRDFLRTRAAAGRVAAADLEGARVVREYRSPHNRVTHLVYRQQFQGLDVLNGDYAVNIDGDGQVINAGGTLARGPRPGLTAPEAVSAMAAVRQAARVVNGDLARRFAPMESERRPPQGLRFAGSAFPEDIDAAPVWWAVRGELRSAWNFTILDADRISRYSVVVDAVNGQILSKTPLTWFQSAPRGLVYDQGSPQPNPKPGVTLTDPPPTVERTMQSFAGDPAASPKGWVSDNQTAGNNVVAGTNPLGSLCSSSLTCITRPLTATAPDRTFSFPIDLGAIPTAWPNASATNVFYWANRAHDWFYALGFDEAAGNFQQDNFGKGGVDGDALNAYAQYGSAASGRAQLNNSFFSSTDSNTDGSPSWIAFLLETANGAFYDNGLDAPTVVHEYTHGVSSRLMRQLSSSHQGGSMGEALSDFFALEFLTPDGAPVDGLYPFSEYPDQLFGRGIRTRPYSTSLDVNPLTFSAMGHVLYTPEVHSDGEIWVEALWEARANLIRQWGEKEGRKRVRQLVVDGMKLSPPAASMLDLRDAILLADQVDYKGASQQQLWDGFAKRGFGVLAMTGDGNTIHVRPSFQTASARGSIGFYEDQFVINELVRVVVQDSNLTGDNITILVRTNSGDQERVVLTRQGQVFTGTLRTAAAPVALNDHVIELTSGDFITAFYNDASTPAGPYQASATAPVSVDYDYWYRPNSQLRFAGEKALGVASTGLKTYVLPWPFPFFSNSYKQIWVDERGLLSFDLPPFYGCADAFGLEVTNGIAPLHMDLTTFGSAQPGEDVYVSQQTADSVTFRWAAETLPDFNGSKPEAVNFAATLFQDGRIQFNYGTGNRNLVGGSNFFGCAATSPTVGISNGHESYLTLIETHDGKGTLENAQTVVLDPPFNPSTQPLVKLETPSPDAKVQGVLSGSGIVYDPDPEGAIRGIDVMVDGIAMAAATTGVSRTDFCAAQKVQGCPGVGFTFQLPLARNNIGAGAHTLQLRTTNRRGYFVDTPPKPMVFTVEAGEPNLPVSAIEAPTAGQEVSGTVTVRGYAYSPSYRVSEVDVLVDGTTAGRASYTTNRTDICGPLTPAPVNCPRVGFTFALDSRGWGDGPHTLALRILDDTGRYVTTALQSPVAVTFKNPALVVPLGAITSPVAGQEVSGSMKIAGYAYSPAGRVSSVTLYVDEYAIGTVPYGSSRPDVCGSLKNVAACPNIGFDLDFDTTRLANGPHYLLVVVRDAAGNTSAIPPTLVGGQDFRVKN